MANRYWVGGTGTWDTTTTTNWSATSGGAGGASVPTLSDSIFFDQAGTYTVTCTGALNCLDFTVSNGVVSFAQGTSPTFSIYGSMNLIAGTLWPATGAITFRATSTGKTVTTNGTIFSSAGITFNSVSGGWTLGSALANSGGIKDITIQAGTFDTGGYNITTGTFTSVGTSTRTLNLNNSTITVGLNVSGGIFAMTNTGITLNAGTSTFINVGSGTYGLGGLTYYNFIDNYTTTGQASGFTGGATFNNLTIVATNAIGFKSVTFDNSGYTINGTFATSNTAGNRRVFFSSSQSGLGNTLTVNGTPNLTDADFRDLYIRGGAFPLSGIRIGNFGNCTGINFSIPKTVYWNLAGTQNWSANAWATTPTGTPSTDNFPLAQDTAKFTNEGSTGSISISAAIEYVPTVDMSARTTAMTLIFNSLGGITTCYGNWTNGSGTTISGTVALTFSSITPGQIQTITSAGKSFTTNGLIVDTYGGTVQLADALNLTTNTLTITNGTFDTMGYAVTCNTLSSTNTNVRTINLRSSTVTLGTNSGSVDFTNIINLTFNAGTSNIILSYATAGSLSVNLGGLTYYNVTFTNTAGTLGYSITGTNTFNNLTIQSTNLSNQIQFVSFSSNQTINGILTCVGASPTRRIFLYSNTTGTQRTLTVNSLSAANCDFRDIAIVGAAAGSSPTGAGDCGGNSGIIFPVAKTVYWNLAGAQNWSSIGWCTSSGGTPDINNFPLAQDTAVIDNTGAITTLNIDLTNAPWNIGTFDASLRTSSMTLSVNSGNFSGYVYGDFKFGTGVTCSVTVGATLAFGKNTTQTITSNGVQFGFNIQIDNSNAYVQLADALSMDSSRSISFTLGTFDAVSYNVTTGSVANSNTSNTIKMGSGTWTIAGTGTVWNLSVAPTLIAGTSTVVLSNTSTSARNFNTGSLYYNKLTIGGSTGTSTLSITGASNFGELASTKTVAHTILFNSSQTHTIGKWSVTGTVGNVVTVGPTTAASTYTLVIAGPANTGINYLSVSYCAVSTTSPGEFYVGANSTNTAGNTGAIFFTATPSPRTLYWRGGTGNWSATTSWDTVQGGAGGAAIPTSLDSVIFDSTSNATAYTATIDTGVTIARCASFNMAGPASGNVTWAGTVPIAFHGNVTFAATGITRTYSGSMNWAGNSSYTFTTNGLSLLSAITIKGIGATWTLGSALNNSDSLTVTYGNFSTSSSNYATSISAISSSNLFVRGLSLNGSTITLTGTGTLVSFNTFRNLTFNAGTSTIVVGALGTTFNGGDQTFYNVTFNSLFQTTNFITGKNTFNNLTVTGVTNVGVYTVSFSADQTINGTLSIGAGTTAAFRTFLTSNTIGTQRTLTCAAISSLTDIDFRDINFAGAITLPVTGTRLGDCKGNSNITFDAPKTVYYGQTVTANWGTTGTGSWSFTNGGAVDATAFPLAQDTAKFTNACPNAGSTVTINDLYNLGTVDMSLRTNSMSIGSSGSLTQAIYGNWINGSGTSFGFSPLNRFTFAGRTTQNITTAGKTWTASLTIESPGGSVLLQDAFTMNVGTTNNNPNILYGTFDANGYNVTLGQTNASYVGMSSSGSNVRAINFGSGTWTFLHGGGSMSLSGSNLTISGTAIINLTNTATTGIGTGGFNFSGLTLNIGGSGQVSISSTTGEFTLGAITKTYVGSTTLSLGTTSLKIGSWNTKGTAGNILTISGTSAASPAKLIYTGTGAINTIDYVVPLYIKAYPTPSTWYAGLGSNSTSISSLGWLYSYTQPLGSFMVYF